MMLFILIRRTKDSLIYGRLKFSKSKHKNARTQTCVDSKSAYNVKNLPNDFGDV